MSLTGRIASLEKQHADLEKQIEAEESRPMSDSLVLRGLKSRKLAVKQEWDAHLQTQAAAEGVACQGQSAVTAVATSEVPHFELVAQSDGLADDAENPDLDNVISIDATYRQPAVPDDEQLEMRLAVNA